MKIHIFWNGRPEGTTRLNPVVWQTMKTRAEAIGYRLEPSEFEVHDGRLTLNGMEPDDWFVKLEASSDRR